jgi:preprotein translocase subunit Sec63
MAWPHTLLHHNRRSYRKMALQFHPDKVTGTEAEKKSAAKKFAEINNAYEVNELNLTWMHVLPLL